MATDILLTAFATFSESLGTLFVAGMILTPFFVFLLIILILSGLKVVQEYERGVKLRFGKYVGVLDPGLRIVIPFIEKWFRVDMRVDVVDVPPQEAITMDNVSVKVNAVIYYKVVDATKAILEVERYHYAISQLAQTTMRDLVGRVDLDTLLSQRNEVAVKIQEIVDKETDPWGISVQNVELKHIDLMGKMKRTIAKQAEAEREKRGVIIKSEGERIAADNIAEAAKTLLRSPGALHLRTLHTINDLSSDRSDTIVFAMPLELMKTMSKMNLNKVAENIVKMKKR